jgi:hypothetical protein
MYTRAVNWKKRELNKLEIIKNELIRKKAGEQIITNFINEQYDIIDKKYNKKIKKYEDNKQNIDNKKIEIKLRKNVIKNLMILDGKIDDNKIKEYADKEYKCIYEKFNIDEVNFIDK